MQGQMAAFSSVMSNTTQAFSGTVIRIPLRTDEQADESDISKYIPTVNEVRRVLGEFATEFGNHGLLFMRNLERLVIQSRPGESSEIRLTNVAAVRE